MALAGDETDRATLLPGLATGETLGTTAVLEPGRRAEWRRPRTTAVAEGDGWRIDGTKVHVIDLGAADVVFATATDADGELGVFSVAAERSRE